MEVTSKEELFRDLSSSLSIEGEHVEVTDEKTFREEGIDSLIWNAVFSPSVEIKEEARRIIGQAVKSLRAFPASIHDLYMAMGRGEVKGFTVPAINIRGMTYDVARAVFRAARDLEVGPFIFEIARSEMGYTNQPPAEYAAAVKAAAVKEGHEGPVFLQGDHFQANAKRYAEDPGKEISGLKDLIRDAIQASFYNIDIDTSTLVDLSRDTVREQQRNNGEECASLAAHVRLLEPDGVTISIGGEIGEVGGKNSTEEELRAFMEEFREALGTRGADLIGISKISVQTGTTHGGVPLADGSIASVKLDFGTLERLSELARKEYGMAGAVQHGASTLPDELFGKFPEVGTAEIHLATQFQNIMLDHPAFPKELREEMYNYLKKEHASERKEGDTEEQFLYKTRKKANGPFKKEMWSLPEGVKGEIMGSLEEKFRFLFEKLRVPGTREVVAKHIKPAG